MRKSRGMDQDNQLFNSKHNYKKCQKPLEMHKGGEACGFINVKADGSGVCTVGLHNSRLGMAIVMRYKKKQLPILCNWQHWGFGDYVCALEPGTNPPIGQIAARKQKKLQTIAPGESRTYDLEISVLAEQKGIDRFLKAAGGK